jgi:sugar-specific transcriptional regulator TrmB
MAASTVDKLVTLGFSEYEAKAYLALLQENPATGYHVSKCSGVPRSMIYEVLGKLVARGAAMTLHRNGSSKYSPIPAVEFLDKLQRDHEDLVTSLRDNLSSVNPESDLEYVWNIEGHENVMAKAKEMLGQARKRVYVSLLPETFPTLQHALTNAALRGVDIVLYCTHRVEFPDGRVVVSPVPVQASNRLEGLWLVMVADGTEALIGELLTQNRARASWTRSPLFVFVAEHHLRTDLYLPRLLAQLGEKALELIDESDRELFATPFESHLEG